MFQHQIINGKNVFVVEYHHHAVMAWHKVYLEMGEKPILISLDFHTDCYDAFLRYAFHKYKKENGREPSYEERMEQSKIELSRIDLKSAQSVRCAVDNLNNDEHIAFSTMAGIIDYAFVIATDVSGNQITRSEEYKYWNAEINKPENLAYKLGMKKGMPQPEDLTYKMPENRIFIFEAETGLIDCSVQERDRKERDSVLETEMLTNRLGRLNSAAKMAGLATFEDHPYILDIDLDYFNTENSIKPRNSEKFYHLVDRASAVTIAKEPGWVDKCKLDEQINSAFILDNLLMHIKEATKPT